MSELKACPFCGGRARITRITEDTACCPVNVGAEYGECSECGLSTRLYFPIKEDARPTLIDEWNLRAITPDVEAFSRECCRILTVSLNMWRGPVGDEKIEDAIAAVKARRGGKL